MSHEKCHSIRELAEYAALLSIPRLSIEMIQRNTALQIQSSAHEITHECLKQQREDLYWLVFKEVSSNQQQLGMEGMECSVLTAKKMWSYTSTALSGPHLANTHQTTSSPALSDGQALNHAHVTNSPSSSQPHQYPLHRKGCSLFTCFSITFTSAPLSLHSFHIVIVFFRTLHPVIATLSLYKPHSNLLFLEFWPISLPRLSVSSLAVMATCSFHTVLSSDPSFSPCLFTHLKPYFLLNYKWECWHG